MKLVQPFLLLIVCVLLFIASSAALAQVTSQTAPAASPEKIVRDFYGWYLHELNKDNYKALKQETTALRYLTPRLYASVPRLERALTADIFVCAQDWDAGWEQHFMVASPAIKGVVATTLVTLPSGADKINVNVTLKRTRAGWRIDAVRCAD
jgi:hypothetical protein